MSRLKDKYIGEIVSKMKEEKGYKNDLEVPRISKIVVSAGVGRNISESKSLEVVMKDLAKIVGQKPRNTVAKKSIAGFKLREGNDIGATATLRGERMYEFLDRLINVSLPRVRDFRGLSPDSFDGKGNYSLGIKEHTVFPEVSEDDADRSFGFQINIVTTAESNEEAKLLLSHFGFPFKKQEVNNG